MSKPLSENGSEDKAEIYMDEIIQWQYFIRDCADFMVFDMWILMLIVVGT